MLPIITSQHQRKRSALTEGDDARRKIHKSIVDFFCDKTSDRTGSALDESNVSQLLQRLSLPYSYGYNSLESWQTTEMPELNKEGIYNPFLVLSKSILPSMYNISHCFIFPEKISLLLQCQENYRLWLDGSGNGLMSADPSEYLPCMEVLQEMMRTCAQFRSENDRYLVGPEIEGNIHHAAFSFGPRLDSLKVLVYASTMSDSSSRSLSLSFLSCNVTNCIVIRPFWCCASSLNHGPPCARAHVQSRRLRCDTECQSRRAGGIGKILQGTPHTGLQRTGLLAPNTLQQ